MHDVISECSLDKLKRIHKRNNIDNLENMLRQDCKSCFDSPRTHPWACLHNPKNRERVNKPIHHHLVVVIIP